MKLKFLYRISVILIALGLILGLLGFMWMAGERAKFTDDNPSTFPSKAFCYVSQGLGWVGFTTGQRWVCLNIMNPPQIKGNGI